MLNDRAAKRGVVKRRAGQWVVQMIGGKDYEPLSTEGISSNAYKTLNSIVQDRLYGIGSVGNAVCRFVSGTTYLLCTVIVLAVMFWQTALSCLA